MDIVKNGFNAVKRLIITNFLKVNGINSLNIHLRCLNIHYYIETEYCLLNIDCCKYEIVYNKLLSIYVSFNAYKFILT
jgi:hypothetical protein